MPPETRPFQPDWTIAPSETLRDLLSERGMSARVLSIACGGRRVHPPAWDLITDVLKHEPLTQAHADCLARGTGVPARTWLNLEAQYRAGLAAGLRDATEDAELPEYD
jgi:hypothetical protein